MIFSPLCLLFIFIAGTLWGSFLNVLGYRVIIGKSIVFPRSHCPSCHTTLAWYDLFPLFSWLWLRGSCRHCLSSISFLYPFIELLTGITFVLLVLFTPQQYWIGYFILCSLLLAITRSDLEFMLISRYTTLFCIPLGFFCAYFCITPLTVFESIRGSLFGYLSLYSIAFLFYKKTGKTGLGQGDIDLLAFIGSFIGILGCWATLLYGSIIGTLCATLYILITGRSKTTRIPFGPFLAIGALFFVLFYDQSIQLLIGDL